MKNAVFLILLVLIPASGNHAQPVIRVMLSGLVTDLSSGECLPGATIWFPTLVRGTPANSYGHYSVSVPPGTFPVEISFVGYQKISREISLDSDTTVNWALIPGVSMNEIGVMADKKTHLLSGAIQSGTYVLTADNISRTPSLLGESDALKTIQLLPGVKAGNEGTSGIQVRGGSHDQNLILLDGVPVYNTNHLFGYLSAFNTDAVKNIWFYKGGMPARYGGRLSSVADIAMKEGNLKKTAGQLSLSPVAGRIMLEGPVKKEVAAFMVSARRSWLDIPLWLKQHFSGDRETFGYAFYDLNAKINWIVSPCNRIYLSHYQGRDGYFMKSSDSLYTDSYRFKWGNFTSVFRWNLVISPRIFMNTSVYHSLYRFGELYGFQGKFKGSQHTGSGLEEYSVKSDLDLTLGQQTVRSGYQLSWFSFRPEITVFSGDSVSTGRAGLKSLHSNSFSWYAEDEFSPFRKVSCNAGLRVMAYFRGDRCAVFPEPRLSVKIETNRSGDFKMSVQRLVQTLHLLTNNALNMPTDLWVPSGKDPARSWLVDIGWGGSIKRGVNLEVDLYYKPMKNLLEYRPGVILLSGMGKSPEELTVSGSGLSFGAEWMLEKNTGRLTGWAGYSLSWALRKFVTINDGKYFPFKYDRRHSFTLRADYSLKETIRSRWMFSGEFVLASGNAITIPDGQVRGMMLPGMGNDHPYIEHFSAYETFPHPNNYRMPLFHHLDIAFSGSKKLNKGRERTWCFSVYNLYNRQNPYFYYKSHGKFLQISMLPAVPSVAWTMKF